MRALSGCTSCSVVEISDYLGNREDLIFYMCLMESSFPGFSITQVSTIFFKGLGSEAQKEGVRRRSLQVIYRGPS